MRTGPIQLGSSQVRRSDEVHILLLPPLPPPTFGEPWIMVKRVVCIRFLTAWMRNFSALPIESLVRLEDVLQASTARNAIVPSSHL